MSTRPAPKLPRTKPAIAAIASVCLSTRPPDQRTIGRHRAYRLYKPAQRNWGCRAVRFHTGTVTSFFFRIITAPFCSQLHERDIHITLIAFIDGDTSLHVGPPRYRYSIVTCVRWEEAALAEWVH